MKIEIDDRAAREVEDAAAWYENKAAGLGAGLVDAFEQAVREIEQFPNAWHPLGGRLRRYRLARFPYGIIYRAQDDTLLIVAFAHHSRRSRYWRDRLRST